MTKHRLKTSPFWAIAVVAALGMGLSACGSSDDDTAEAPTVTEPTGPAPAEQIATLQGQINDLRAELGLDPIDIDDLTGSVATLTQQVANLQKQIDDAADTEAAAAAKAHRAKLQKLAEGISTGIGITSTQATANAVPIRAEAMRAMNEEKDTALDEPWAINGWSGTSWESAGGTGATATTTTAVVYNNKGPSTSIAFNKKHTLDDGELVL